MIANRTKLSLDIKWMIRRDYPDVLRIEAKQFEEYWIEDDFVEWLRNKRVIGMVAELNGRIVGFMVYQLFKKSLVIQNFAVDPGHERQGIGRAMMDRLKSKLSYQGRDSIMCIESESNVGAHCFLRAMGLNAVRVIPNYDSAGAAYVFRFTMPEDAL